MSENISSDFSRLFSDPSALSNIARLIRGMGADGLDTNKIIEGIATPSQSSPAPSDNAASNVDTAPASTTAPSADVTPAVDAAADLSTQKAAPVANQNTDPLSAMLANPEVIAKLPQIISAARPILSAIQPSPSSGSPSASEVASQPTSSTEAQRSNASPHTLLLSALRPYLSHSRQDALDGIVRITGLMEVMRMLNPPENK